MDDLDKPLTQIDRLILHLDNDLSPPCLESLRDEIVALEARITKTDALAEAHLAIVETTEGLAGTTIQECRQISRKALAAYREGSDT